MKKKLVMILTLVLAVSAVTVCAEAAFTASVSYVPENGEVTIAGSADGDVVILIAPDGLLPENMSPSQLPTGIKQITADGTYTCTLAMPSDALGGNYMVYVFCNGTKLSDSFIYMNLESANAIIPKLNAASGSEFEILVSSDAFNLGIDANDEKYIANKSNIISMLDILTFEDVTDFYAKYSKTYAMCAIEGEANHETVESLLSKYAIYLKIDYNTDYVEDERIDAAAKEELLNLLAAVDYSAKADANGNVDFATVFSECKALAAVRTASNWVDMKQAITQDFAANFKAIVNGSRYDSVVDKDSVFEALMKSKPDSMEDIEQAFLKAVNEVYSKENKKNEGKTSSGSVTIPENIAVQTQTQISFVDISKDHWASVAIMVMAEDGVISGYEDGSFKPSLNITRAEFTKMIVKFAEAIETTDEIVFDDIKNDDWYFGAVTAAASKGIVKGDGTKFRPGEYIKREDAALIVYRLRCLLGETPLGHKPFADRGDISEYAKDAVYALGGAGVVQGDSNNMFLPQNNITRAEAAQLIYNAFINQ